MASRRVFRRKGEVVPVLQDGNKVGSQGVNQVSYQRSGRGEAIVGRSRENSEERGGGRAPVLQIRGTGIREVTVTGFLHVGAHHLGLVIKLN